MLTKYVIRGATDDDALLLAPIMRDLDIQELAASTGDTPLSALQQGLLTSSEVYTALADGVPYAMFGVVPVSILGGVGLPWLLTSKDVVKHAKEIVRWSEPVARHWVANSYTTLINMIDGRHKPALRWAKHVGFTVHAGEPYGIEGRPFHKIEMRR